LVTAVILLAALVLLLLPIGHEARNTVAASWRSATVNGGRRVFVVQISAILSILLAVAVVLSLLTLEAAAVFRWKRLGIGRWIACRMADYGPALFLISSVVFLWNFRPFEANLSGVSRERSRQFRRHGVVLGAIRHRECESGAVFL
jgi:hypothetical protein